VFLPTCRSRRALARSGGNASAGRTWPFPSLSSQPPGEVGQGVVDDVASPVGGEGVDVDLSPLSSKGTTDSCAAALAHVPPGREPIERLLLLAARADLRRRRFCSRDRCSPVLEVRLDELAHEPVKLPVDRGENDLLQLAVQELEPASDLLGDELLEVQDRHRRECDGFGCRSPFDVLSGLASYRRQKNARTIRVRPFGDRRS
jgi:hypothetical protein